MFQMYACLPPLAGQEFLSLCHVIVEASATESSKCPPMLSQTEVALLLSAAV